MRRPTRSRSKYMKQTRPLKPLHDVQIDDVDTIFLLKRFLNRLVSREVRELHQRAYPVEHLEGRDHLQAVRLRHPPRRQRRVDAEAGVEQAGGHGFGEVSGDSLRGRSVGSGELRDLEEELVGFFEVIGGDSFGALEEESEEMQTFFVLLLTLDLFFSLSQRLRRGRGRGGGGGHGLRRRWRVLPFLLLNRRRRRCRRLRLLLLLLLLMVERLKRLRRRRRVGGGGRRIKKHERAESVLEESAEVRVAREDDVSNVLDELRDGD